MPLPRSLDPGALRRVVPGFAYWFRYPLRADDFHPLRADADARARLLGYYATKPLYGKFDGHGRVDRSGGFNGAIVALFVPSPARAWRHARLVHARMPRQLIRRAHGSRNWPAIRRTAEAAIRRSL